MTGYSDQTKRALSAAKGGATPRLGAMGSFARRVRAGGAGRMVRHPAFSLLELMIGIMVLGMGMVLVATMFPVAWHRARELNEYTVQKTTAAGAHDTIKSLVQVAGPFEPSSFAGDLLLDPAPDRPDGKTPTVARSLLGAAGAWQCADTRVHALNLQNIQVENRAFVDEDSWDVEQALDLTMVEGWPGENVEREHTWYTYVRAQVQFGQRVYPPLTRDRDNVNATTGAFDDDDTQWDGWVDATRYCWAVLHRLRPLPASPTLCDCDGFCWVASGTLWGNPKDRECANGVVGEAGLFDDPSISDFERSLELYYVTLRRPQPTYRYARQDPDKAPDPHQLGAAPTIGPLPKDQDVMFPVPWRVQVQFPTSLNLQLAPTGVPTEIEVPSSLDPSPASQKAMVVQMFPRGAWFVDEITGAVYKVIKRRITGPKGEQAFLTLDQEVFLEDLDLAKGASIYGPCATCTPLDPADPFADPEELLRTVIVFPPPSTRLGSDDEILVFEGSQPVVEIERRSLKRTPG